MYKILGIDPGLSDTGIGIVEGKDAEINSYSFGHITTSKKQTTDRRLFEIYLKIDDLLKQERPDLILMEDVFSLSINPSAGISLGKVSGVITIAAFNSNILITEILPKELKQRLTGNGNASKSQIEMSVRNLINHPEKISPYHSSDALALAIIGLYSYEDFISMKEAVT